MAVARSDDGAGNVTRRRTTRKAPVAADAAPPAPSPAPPPAAVLPPPPYVAPPPPARLIQGLRLDDLYRLEMPRLFRLAEREGVAEHTGMTRAQLIVAVVRRQVERGEVVRGSGTLEV